MTPHDSSDTSDWEPRPARLRKGEQRDISGHAQRNLEQIREGVRTGHLTEAEYAEAERRIVAEDQEVKDRE